MWLVTPAHCCTKDAVIKARVTTSELAVSVGGTLTKKPARNRYDPFTDDLTLEQIIELEQTGSVTDPEEKARIDALSSIIAEAIESLAADEISIIRGLFFQGRSMVELAAQFGISEKKLPKLKERAVFRLKQELSERLGMGSQCPICTHEKSKVVIEFIDAWVARREGKSSKQFGLSKAILTRFGIRFSRLVILYHMNGHKNLGGDGTEELSLEAREFTTVEIPVSIKERMRALAIKTDRTPAEILRHALRVGVPALELLMQLDKEIIKQALSREGFLSRLRPEEDEEGNEVGSSRH